MIVLINRTIYIHFVYILDLEGITGIEGPTAGRIEYILSISIPYIICIMACIIAMFDRITGLIFSDFNGNGILGKILTVLGNGDSVHDRNRNSIFIGFLVSECGKGHAVVTILIYQEVFTVFRLLTDFKFHLACSTGIGILG